MRTNCSSTGVTVAPFFSSLAEVSVLPAINGTQNYLNAIYTTHPEGWYVGYIEYTGDVHAEGTLTSHANFEIVFDPTAPVAQRVKLFIKGTGLTAGTKTVSVTLAGPAGSDTANVSVTVNTGANTPTLDITVSNASVASDAASGTVLATITGTNPDPGDSELDYSLIAASGAFTIVKTAATTAELRVDNATTFAALEGTNQNVGIRVSNNIGYPASTADAYAAFAVSAPGVTYGPDLWDEATDTSDGSWVAFGNGWSHDGVTDGNANNGTTNGMEQSTTYRVRFHLKQTAAGNLRFPWTNGTGWDSDNWSGWPGATDAGGVDVDEEVTTVSDGGTKCYIWCDSDWAGEITNISVEKKIGSGSLGSPVLSVNLTAASFTANQVADAVLWNCTTVNPGASPTYTLGSGQTYGGAIKINASTGQGQVDNAATFNAMTPGTIDIDVTVDNGTGSPSTSDTEVGDFTLTAVPTAPPQYWPNIEFNDETGLTFYGSYSVSGGQLTLTGTGGADAECQATVKPLPLGAMVKATVDIDSITGSLIYGWDHVSGHYQTASTAGIHEHTFVVQGAVDPAGTSLLAEDGNSAVINSYRIDEVAAAPNPTPAPGPGPAPSPGPAPAATVLADHATLRTQFLPTAPNYQLDDATAAKATGGGVYPMDVRTNRVIGKSTGERVAHKFRAPASGSVTEIRLEWAHDPGYAAGDGGIIRGRLYPDNGSGKPNEAGTLHAEFTFDLPQSNNAWTDGGNDFRSHTVTSYASITKGSIYHFVLDNIHSDPVNNWTSNQSSTLYGDNNDPASPIYLKEDWVVEYANTGNPTWQSYNDTFATLIPIYEMKIGGSWHGHGNIGPGNYIPGGDRTFLVTNSAPIRTRIAPLSTRVWRGGAINILCVVAGDMDWALTSGATTLASGSFSHPSNNVSTTAQESGACYVFEDIWFPFWFGASGVTLHAGTEYFMTYTPRTTSQWRAAVQADGRAFGFVGEHSRSPDVSAQHYQSGSWGHSQNYTKSFSGSAYCVWRDYFIRD